jgi:hypothetical protein
LKLCERDRAAALRDTAFEFAVNSIFPRRCVATGIDNTSVTRQPQAEEGALTNLAEKLRHDSRHLADRSQQDVRSMPIMPSLLGSAQTEPLMPSAASNKAAPERMSGPPRMPRIDDLPLPAQNEIRAAQRKEREDGHPEKRGKTLMQRLASVGLGRTQSSDARNSIDEDGLDIPAFLRRPPRPNHHKQTNRIS